MRLFPYLQPLANISGLLFLSVLWYDVRFLGLLNYITTEISSSKQKKFPLVSFIDTPGLVDGAMAYPFDVEKAILWLGLLRNNFVFYLFSKITSFLKVIMLI